MKKSMLWIMTLVLIAVLAALPVLTMGATGTYTIVSQPGAEGVGNYDTYKDASENYVNDGSSFIRLLQDTDEDMIISRDVYLDLNGCTISGDITISSGATLYCMDTQTDDYDVEDGNGYGMLTGGIYAYGELKAVEAGSGVSAVEVRDAADPTPYRAGYLQVNEMQKGVSFHRVDLDITHVVFSPENVGISYQSPFSGDQVVEENVSMFGVALSLVDYPNAQNLNTDCKYTMLTDFTAGKEANIAKSSKLTGVMAEKNGYFNNNRNAQLPIYGSAYILTPNGYMFGSQKQTTMKQVVELASDSFSIETGEPLRSNTANMYRKFADDMKYWDVTQMKEVYEAIRSELEDDGVLKILMIGNSHGLDATRMLYEVFQAENPGKEIVIGALYHSGCTLFLHQQYIKENATQYIYYKMDKDIYAEKGGNWQRSSGVEASDGNITDGVTMEYALTDENWDIVTIQQMNTWSAISDYVTNADGTRTYTEYGLSYMDTILDFINEKVDIDPKIGWHAVWTNPNDESLLAGSSDTWKSRYEHWFGGSQQNMYDMIVAATKKHILSEEEIDFMIPSGTAIQYAQNVCGRAQTEMYRDYTHLSGYGRLMAAYTWYAQIMGIDSVDEVKVNTIRGILCGESTGDVQLDAAMKADIIASVNHALNFPLEVPVEKTEEPLKILCIGNSYSEDSMRMLAEVYKAESPDREFVFGRLYHSGCTLAMHANYINNNSTEYIYYKTNASGTWTRVKPTDNSAEQSDGHIVNGATMVEALTDEDWDVVVLQQSGLQSGQPSSFNADIDTIRNKVIETLGKTPRFFWNMTWSLPVEDIEGDAFNTKNTSSSFLSYYGGNQMTHYQAIVDTAQAKLLTNPMFEKIIPVGTAIQNARSSYLGDPDLHRDNSHLSDLGRLIAAYTWYCSIEQKTLDEIQLTTIPKAVLKSYITAGGTGDMVLTSSEVDIVVESVKNALRYDFNVTDSQYTVKPE